MRVVRPSEAIEGGDETLEQFGEGLINLGQNIIMDYEVSEGNVEWLERHAAFLRDRLEERG